MICSRRTCIAAMLLGAGALSLSPLLRADQGQSVSIEDFLRKNPEALHIGKLSYEILRLEPEDLELMLRRRLAGATGAADALAVYHAAVREDFRSGALHYLQGWPVSQTEALAYALIYARSASSLRR